MKLQELIDTKYKTTKKDDKFDLEKLEQERKVNDKKQFTEPDYKGGTGMYANVEIDKDQPFIAKKQHHFPVYDPYRDAYFVYIKTIANNGLAKTNPFFPRVYDVDVEQDSNGVSRPTYDIETLHNADNFTTEALLSLGKKLFKDFDGYFMAGANITPMTVAVKMADILKKNLHSHTRNAIRNKHLVDAMDLITTLLQDNNDLFWLDMHAGNIMFRGTPHGPQLVITDPMTDTQQWVK